MSSIPQIPENAPFTTEQRAWINGYLAGLFSSDSGSPASAISPALSKGSILFLFGSQTGSSEGLARRFGKEAKKRGYETRILGMEDYKSVDLAAEKNLALITSTYGDGEMPDNAQEFWNYLSSEKASQLPNLSFSVLALGDRNYAQFCEAGVQFDRRLQELGAVRIADRIDCDVEYEEPAQAWLDSLLGKLGGETSAPISTTSPAPVANEETGEKESSSFGKSNPFPAQLRTNRPLNTPGSEKETRHFEIILEGSGLSYEAGDALGVHPKNCPELVEGIIESAGLTGEESVSISGGTLLPLREALQSRFDLSPFLGTSPEKGIAASDLVAPLRKLQPRLYSISSSPKAHPGEVHLTVAIVRYELNGRACKGVCSTFLADRVGEENRVPVFIHKSPSFRLPQDLSKPVIMVGPGTGIAPFRAFLEERRATGSTGKNWLFFGDQRAATDFLYREEMEEMQREGLLTRLDLAFSRDQQEKIYVQHRMMEQAEELWEWLQEGAFFYVCGDAKRMAKDVDAALHQIAESAGGLSTEAAAEFIKELKSQKRYLRDVY